MGKDPVASWLSTLVSEFLSSVSSATVACSLAVSTPLPGLTHTKKTRESWVLYPHSLRRRLRSPSERVQHTLLTQYADACRCSPRSRRRSIFTRAPVIVSKRSPQRKASPQACTRDSWQTWCAVWAEPSSLSSTTGPRHTLASDLVPWLMCCH